MAFNAIPLRSTLTGIGNYIVHLAAALAATGDVDLYAFYGGALRHETPSQRSGASRASATQVARRIVKHAVPFRRTLRHAQLEWLFRRGARRAGIDVYHEPNYVPFRVDAPVAITIHDLSWIRYPQTHPRERVRWLERGVPRAIARADAIIVDAEFTKRELQQAFGVAPSRVNVIPLGVAAHFHPRTPAQTRVSLSDFDLAHGRYILTLGTMEPRKNVAHALAAYAALPGSLRERYPLVVAGARGWRAGLLTRRLQAMSARGEVRFLGHVPDAALPDLYAGAALFVFPSLYEGFGLPPLEAMACGVPVLVSNRASLPEVVGDAAILIDPDRPEETRDAIERVLDDDALRERLSVLGRRRADRFNWEACATQTLALYRALVTNAR
ncbi:MAG TPA: glycosyltransferase family 1 protein [Casimicrobiaceae bacterium]|nr:glycosyltransferase family 1 protein [Casimicrobiaceae bacterium]